MTYDTHAEPKMTFVEYISNGPLSQLNAQSWGFLKINKSVHANIVSRWFPNFVYAWRWNVTCSAKHTEQKLYFIVLYIYDTSL